MNELDNNNPQARWPKDLDSWEQNLRIQIETALTALVERNVNVVFEKIEPFNAKDIEQLFSAGLVRVSIPLGPAATWHYLIPQPMAAAMSNLAESGDGDVTYDSAVHDSVISDVMLQIMAMLEPELGSVIGPALALGEPETGADIETKIESWSGMPSTIWKVKIEEWGEDNILKIMEFNFDELPEVSDAPEEDVEESVDPLDTSQEIGGAISGSQELTADMLAAIGAPVDEPAFDPPPSVPDPTPQPAQASGSGAFQQQPVVKTPAFEPFGEAELAVKSPPRNLEILMDINLPVTIELGRTSMLVKDVLELGPGSVIELDKLSGEPVDLLVNDKKFAKGEVVVIEENFGIRITELLQVDERINALR